MALKSVDDVDDNGFDNELLLQRLHILSRTLETFSRITIEGQEVETMLNLKTLRKMNQLKSIMLINQKKKLVYLLEIL